MTKVQLRYDLMRPLEDDLLEAIARVHSVWGIERVRFNETHDKLIVDYDASRLSAMEVETILHKAGLPIILNV